MSSSVAILLQSTGLGGLLLAAGEDLRARIIRNQLALWVLGAGLASRLVVDGWASWLSAVTALAVFVPLGLLVPRNVIGGGDAKMIAAATCLFEPTRVPQLLLAIALAGGALAVTYMAVSRMFRSRWVGRPAPSDERAPSPGLVEPKAARTASKTSIPFGVAIFAGSAFVFLQEAF
ncbi:MAG: A24 family peptidase [Caulobacteraceae bacterium]|nr:A24 family peptidase [Caulobacteraceae bacterium]